MTNLESAWQNGHDNADFELTQMRRQLADTLEERNNLLGRIGLVNKILGELYGPYESEEAHTAFVNIDAALNHPAASVRP